MRTLAIRLLGLLLLCAGLLLVAAVTDSTGTVSGMLQKLPSPAACPVMAAGIDWRLVGGIAGGCFVLLGLVGLFSRNRQAAGRISFRGDHGEVIIELRPIRKTLARIIGTLPEVYRARVHVKPEQDGRRVQVRVEVMLQNCAEQGLRRTAGLVSGCISEAVGKAMGLEDLATVQLVVKGVHVDARATALRLHDEVEARRERENTSLEVAVARPPISSVTMEELKTEDPEPVVETRPLLSAVTLDEPKAAAPEPAAEMLSPLSPFTMEEPKAAEPEPVMESRSTLPPFRMDEPTADTPEPAAEAEPVTEDIPLAIAAAPEEVPEDRPEDTPHRPLG